jgi:hypothetical protein
MVKYGKEFRKNQNIEWVEKYFDYKGKKKMIKEYLQKRESLNIDEVSFLNELEKWSKDFEENISKDVKKAYIFYTNKERALYKNINESLHVKDYYEKLDLFAFVNEFKKLKETSELSLKLSNFIYYNLNAVLKILKKFDKKIITQKYKDYKIRFNYIQTKIEEQNSDILYLIKFKMIDEVNVILENLINDLMKEFKSNKDILEEDNQEKNDAENKLIEEVPDIKDATKIIKDSYDSIKDNIQKIDKISANVQTIFIEWKDFLKLSTDINSKFLQINRESSVKESRVSERTQSIAQVMGFSKVSKHNIYIILTHGFLYMFSFSVIIPTSYLYLYNFNHKKNLIYWAILMVMAPLGTLFNYLYEAFLFKKSTKTPLIFSCIGLIVGNLLYSISGKANVKALTCVGRFICGLFNLRTHNKMYIINFLTKKDVSFYLTMFHTASILGLGFGFLINVGLLHIELDNQFFNKYTIGSIISIAFSFVLLIISIILFTEAHSSKFSITSMQMFGEGIMGDDDNINETDFAVRKQTMALKDIDTQLGSFNRENRFDDTNLVSKSVSELAMREEGQLHYLLKDFIVYLLIIFTTKFVNESIIINSFIIYVDESGKTNDTTYLWIISLILGGSSLLILLVELSLSRKYKFITERALIIILLVILLIINILLIIFVTKSTAIYILVGLDNIVTSITEKYVAHLFLYIMPENYIICKINGNVFINIFSMISRIICCILILLSDLQSMYKYIICIPMISLCFISTLLYAIFFKEIRVKAINRILKSNPTDEIKIATEL